MTTAHLTKTTIKAASVKAAKPSDRDYAVYALAAVVLALVVCLVAAALTEGVIAGVFQVAAMSAFVMLVAVVASVIGTGRYLSINARR